MTNFPGRNLERFFKDKHGKWAVVQFPNPLLAIWIILVVISWLFPALHFKVLQTCVLFAWSYLELTAGDSPFRKTLGGVVLVSVIIGVVL